MSQDETLEQRLARRKLERVRERREMDAANVDVSDAIELGKQIEMRSMTCPGCGVRKLKGSICARCMNNRRDGFFNK